MAKETGMARPRPNVVAIMEDRLGAVLSRSAVSALQSGLGGTDYLGTVSPMTGRLPVQAPCPVGRNSKSSAGTCSKNALCAL